MMRVDVGGDSMTQIEYMARTLPETGKGRFNLAFNNPGVRQHDGGVKIALQGHTITHPGPCFGKGYRPIHTQSVTARVCQFLKMGITAFAK
jgi:hypothetical protein